MATLTTLTAQVTNLLVYDFEVPVAAPDTGVTATEITAMLNIAQDDLARKINLFNPNIAVNFPTGSSISFTNAVFSKRLDRIVQVLSATGVPFPIGDMTDYNPGLINTASISTLFIDSEIIYFWPALTVVTAAIVQAFYLPTIFVAGGDVSGLPAEIADRHLARYCVATNANVFGIEPQQAQRLLAMEQAALDACDKFTRKNRMNRGPIAKAQGNYRT